MNDDKNLSWALGVIEALNKSLETVTAERDAAFVSSAM